MKKLLEWFNTVDHPMFELLTQAKMSQNVISFANGFWDYREMRFTKWEEAETVPVTDHYFERSFDADELLSAKTPLWDGLITKQLGSRGKCIECDRCPVYADNTCELHCGVDSPSDCFVETSLADMLEIMIGRVFYPIGTYNNWQVCLFLKGEAATGKSTILDLIKCMFAPSATGVITATHEGTFGLENLYQKRAVLVPDLPKQFSKIVNQSDFQSMCSGEAVSIARKNKTAISDRNWSAPLLFAGHYLPDYNDNSGSI